jgi:hypothetical protein
MNHKILTNQIVPSLTEGYLSPCPSLSLSLSLSLPHGLLLTGLAIKNLLPDHSSLHGHFGAYNEDMKKEELSYTFGGNAN